MKPTLLILAAGMGSRYGGLKQIDALGPQGETIIDYSIYDAVQAGFGKIVFVIRRSFEAAFKAKFAGKFEGKIAVDYAYQEVDVHIKGMTEIVKRSKPWGTAHAVLAAKDCIQEPFAVINADDYYGQSAFHQMAKFLTEKVSESHYAMIGYVLNNTLSPYGPVSRGVCEVDDRSYLVSVVERKKIQRASEGGIYFEDAEGQQFPLPETGIVSMNYWGFHPNIFETSEKLFHDFARKNYQNPKAEFFIPLVTDTLLQTQQIKLSVITSQDRWYGVTYQADKPGVVKAFQTFANEGKYPVGLEI